MAVSRFAIRAATDAFSLLKRWVGGGMAECSEERLVFRFEIDEPVDIDALGDGFVALAAQFRRHLNQIGADPKQVPARLVVTDLRSGSVEFEIALPIVTMVAQAAMAVDYSLIWASFFEKIGNSISYLGGMAPRPANFDREDAKDFHSFLGVVQGKRKPGLNMRRAKFHGKTKSRETIAEFEFDEGALANAGMQLAVDMDEVPIAEISVTKNHRMERSVPFVWYRTDREKGKSAGQTSDRGIVTKVTDRPLPVYFASDMKNQKNSMIKTEHNPFSVVYIVDVSVEYSEADEPRTYTITNIHKVVTGGDSD